MIEAETEFETCLGAMPLIAILRGLAPSEAKDVGEVLCEAGFRLIEVPLNSPDPLRSIRILSTVLEGQAMIGAGTVLAGSDVPVVAKAGARLVVAPNFDPEMVRMARECGCVPLPGIMTPSEAIAALNAGAGALKLFPAEALGAPFVNALRAVLPPEAKLVPVGGISPQSMADYWRAGAAGFGVGSALYKPGKALATIAESARVFVDRARELMTETSPRETRPRAG